MWATGMGARTRLLRLIAAGAAVLAVGAGVGVAVSGDDGDEPPAQAPAAPALPPPAAPDGSELDADRIYKRAAPAVVVVQAPTSQGAAEGSGFVIDDSGSIVTNAHVVGEADEVSVRFVDDRAVSADVAGTDRATDLALLEVDPDAVHASPLPLGDSDSVAVGDEVVAIGNPLGVGPSVSSGIVSALDRSLTAPNGASIQGAIQTDAAVNLGSSGGPLIDARGRVIGITSQIATPGGSGSVGVGFAIPIDTVEEGLAELR